MPDNTLLTKQRLAAVATLIAVAAIVATGLISRRSQAEALDSRATSQTVRPVKLVEPTVLASTGLELPARLEAWARAPINARVSGYLKRWNVDIGGTVKAGQLLGELETPELDEQLTQARAELATARSNATLAASTAKRWQSLLASDSVSRQEADEKTGDLAAKESAVNALQANVDRVQATRQYARLIAPFDGVVTSRNTDVGALVSAGSTAGQELFVVSDIRRLRVYVNVPQRQVTAVREGAEAELVVPERPAQVYKARVENFSRAIQSGSGAMLVQLSVDNKAGDLLPGGFATVKFAQTPGSEGRIGIPPGALLFGKDGVRVATLEGQDRVRIKPVTIARDLGSVVEIESGLQRSDRVIDSPPDGLTDGDRVRIAKRTTKAAT
jgi:RND family efflux transporter MFP subunit